MSSGENFEFHDKKNYKTAIALTFVSIFSTKVDQCCTPTGLNSIFDPPFTIRKTLWRTGIKNKCWVMCLSWELAV